MSNRYTSTSSLSDECAFCLESINEYDYATLNCNHKYHLRCIQEWVNNTKKITKLCPLCNIDGEILIIQSGKKSENILVNEQSYYKKNNINQNSGENNTNHQSPADSQPNNQTQQRRTSQLSEIEDEVSYICCTIL